MRISKVLAIIGLVFIFLGVALALIPTTKEVWIPKKQTLVEEVVTVYPQWDYYPYYSLAYEYITQESRNFVVNGTVKELKGRTFDFYVFNEINYEQWKAGVSHETYFKAENVSSQSFSFLVAREDIVNGIRFVVLNNRAKEPAQESWVDTVFTVPWWMDHSHDFYFYPYVDYERLPIFVEGKAEELTGQEFNLIILDDKNYKLWDAGQPYNAFYEARRVSTCSFSFSLSPEKVKEPIYFIVDRVEPDVELKVRTSSNIYYMKPLKIFVRYDIDVSWEERMYAYELGGFILGAELLFLGVILMIAAAIMKYLKR